MSHIPPPLSLIRTKGGGIPEIKAFLNGVNLNEFVNIRLLLAKIIGICFAIASGLPVGKKGPLIQIGSIIAAVISQGKNKVFGFNVSMTKIQDFRNDQTKRDFVTYGTAAGVAAGFRSPIGLVLLLVLHSRHSCSCRWRPVCVRRGCFILVVKLNLSYIRLCHDHHAHRQHRLPI